MIDFLSSWAEQIVLAVIIATIIELILPKSKNKKYIQMVIGIYIMFNIISPIIKNKDILSVEEINTENYTTNSEYVIDQSSMDKRLEKIYLEELEENVTTKFEDAGYTVSKCEIDAELDTTKKNAGIHNISVKIKSPAEQKELDKIKTEIATEYEIEESKISVIVK